MKLYKVTCAHRLNYSKDFFDVFVVGDNPNQVGMLALEKMRELKYKYDSYISNIELLADERQYDSPGMLIVAD